MVKSFPMNYDLSIGNISLQAYATLKVFIDLKFPLKCFATITLIERSPCNCYPRGSAIFIKLVLN